MVVTTRGILSLYGVFEGEGRSLDTEGGVVMVVVVVVVVVPTVPTLGMRG